MAAPIGVLAAALTHGGWKAPAVSNSVATLTEPPNVMQATSTRFAASSSATRSSRKALSPALSSAIGAPSIDADTSRSSRQGQRGSGFSAKSLVPNGFWSTGSTSLCEGLTAHRSLAMLLRNQIDLQVLTRPVVLVRNLLTMGHLGLQFTRE